MTSAIKNGARLLFGDGSRPSEKGDGYYFSPTILTDVSDHSLIASTEIFGPVTCLYCFDDELEALELVKKFPYGLSAGIYCSQLEKVRRLVRNLRTVNVWVNGYKKLDPAMPFGGVKSSGFGKECGIEGILSFTRTKSVVESFSV